MLKRFATLAVKRSAGVAPEVNFRECIICMPPPSTNKAAHSGFETQRCQRKSKTVVSVAPQKGYILFLKKLRILAISYNFSNENKLEVLTNGINFNVNLYLPRCFELNL